MLFYIVAKVAAVFARNMLGRLYCCISGVKMFSLILTFTLALYLFGNIPPQFTTLYFQASLKLRLIWSYMYFGLISLSHFKSIIKNLTLNANDIHQNPGPVSVTNNDILTISHLNVQSLVSDKSPDPAPFDDTYVKVDEIYKQQVLSMDADIITLSETWLGDSIPDIDISLENYTLFRRDRSRDGGGVAAYVRESLSVARRSDLECDGVESIWLEVKLQVGNTFIGSYYRAPGATADKKDIFLNSMQHSIDMVLSENPISIIILGDMNDRCKQFYSNHTESELHNRLLDLVQTNNMQQLITEPTRITMSSEYLLDLIITDTPGYVLDVGVTTPICTVDHHGVFCKMNFKINKQPSFERKIYNYTACNFIGLRENLSYAPWESDGQFADINDSTNYLTTLLLSVIDIHIPNKIVKIKPKDKPWMTNAIHFLLNKRDRLYKRYSKHKSPFHYTAYKYSASAAREAINAAKISYYNKQISRLQNPETSAKEYHKLCKRFYKGKSQSCIPALIDGDTIYSTAEQKAELFNTFFANNATLPEPASGFALPPLQLKTAHRLSTISFTPSKVFSVLKHLKINKSNGPDCISNRILKECAEVLAQPLSDLFNKSMSNGCVPDAWKRANVTPIHKKSDKQNKQNYRPISLLSCMGKVMERIIYDELYEYLETHCLLTWRNSGFKKQDSTVNQLLLLSHKIYTSLGDGSDILVVFLDVSKAFDRVYHQGLLLKLETLGINDNLLKWFISYLSGRTQRVVLDGQASSWRPINAGVPQGSILGPLLFLIFMNDIVDHINSDPFLYADDTSLLKEIKSNNDLTILNDDLQSLSNWAAQWRVNFNAQKTVGLFISKKHGRPDPPPLFLDGIKIQYVKAHCHLGLWLSENMSWEPHIQELTKRAASSVSMLKRMGHSFSRKTKLAIYTSYIRPKLEYATNVYSNNLSENQTERLEAIQRQALIHVASAYRHTNHSKLLIELGIEPLIVRRKYFALCHLHKIINHQTPLYLNNLLPPMVHDVSRYRLRNSQDFSIPTTTKNYIKQSFFWNTLYDWNSLDHTLRHATTLNQFKNSYKSTFFYPKNRLYESFSTRASIHQSRMRMGLSALNYQRKQYNFIDDDSCPNCGISPEDTIHFFLQCPSFAAERNILLRDIADLFAVNLPHLDIKSSIPRIQRLIVNILLSGCDLFSFEHNFTLFKIVQVYISNTNRFN